MQMPVFYAKLCALWVSLVFTLRSVSCIPINQNRDYLAQEPLPVAPNGQASYSPNGYAAAQQQNNAAAYSPNGYAAAQQQNNAAYSPNGYAAAAQHQNNAEVSAMTDQRNNYNGGVGNSGNTAADMAPGQAQGFNSPPRFETILTEDNTHDYMNYNNNYDVNVIHSAERPTHSHEHTFTTYKGNGIEKDVGTKDRVAHDPRELEAVAMRAISHYHDDDMAYDHNNQYDFPDVNGGNTPQPWEPGQWNQGNVPESRQWNQGNVPGSGQWNQGNVPGSGQLNQGNIPESGQWNQGNVPGSGQWNQGNIPESGQWNQGNVPGSGQLNRGNVPGSSQLNQGNIPGSGQLNQGNILGSGPLTQGDIAESGQTGNQDNVPESGQLTHYANPYEAPYAYDENNPLYYQ